MSRHIIDHRRASAHTVGAKAFNLLLLQKQGFDVPAFFVVHPPSSDVVEFHDELRSYLKQHFPKGTRFAVRSSASAEDQPKASFAGQFATFLDVPVRDVATKVLACVASLKSQTAAAYAREHSLTGSNTTMSVVVQEMVDADVSGVAFSANPQGLLNEFVITVGKGLGSGVVSDKTPTTTYYYNSTDRISYYESQAEAPRLDEATLDKLIDNIHRITKHFGQYVDIEFAVMEGRVFLLQVRPITTIDESVLAILDNSNIVESYPGITLPLTISFAKTAYHRVFRGAMMRGLRDNALVEKHDAVLSHMVESVNGRMYYRISNWYALIQYLPFSSRILPVWQDMLGIRNRQSLIPKNYQKEPNPVREIQSFIQALYTVVALPHKMTRLNADFQTTQAFFRKRYRPSLSTGDALALYRQIGDRVLKDWDLTLSNDIYTFAFTGLLKRQLEKAGAPDSSANLHLSGLGNLESADPVKGVVALAELILRTDIVPELSKLKQDSELLKYLSAHPASSFTREFNGYLDKYGDRSLEELKLESQTFRTSPLLLLHTVLAYAKDPERLVDIKLSLEPKPYTVNKLRGLAGFYRSRAALGIANREQSRLNRARIFGMVRTLFLTIANRLTEQGRLERPEDIFYLTVDEVEHAASSQATNLKSVIKQRRAEYELFRRLPAYTRLVFAGEPFSKHHSNVNSHSVTGSTAHLSGTPCSHGQAEGEVVVVNGTIDTSIAKDKILVTKTTDPGWVFMLAVAKGVVAEKGSLLSHTAIITRELGIPSVVGVARATTALKTGDRVRLDGTTGRIEVLTK